MTDGETAGAADDESDGGQPEGVEEVVRVSRPEIVVTVVGVVVVVALVAFALSQAFADPQATTPEATVTDRQPLESGSVAFTVEFRNPMDVGVITATVEAACTSPSTELVFENVPAGGRRSATVVCPLGSERAGLSLSTWMTG